ncbi:hypothetical protein ACFSAH_14360 [Pseudopedobacter beijingensis]|uniref:Uncharacterized protein n=2 Tax=Pseudopedobacter beijingensis TaxID=1207056 RepID=A0ABW4IHE1_9SPHI
MKFVTTIFLAIAILSANFSRLFVFAGFELNKNYIAAVLCENKDKPQMHCNGKCYLAKKLEQAKEKQKQQEKENQKNAFQEAFFEELAVYDFKISVPKVQNATIPHFKVVVKSVSIFHPPQV